MKDNLPEISLVARPHTHNEVCTHRGFSYYDYRTVVTWRLQDERTIHAKILRTARSQPNGGGQCPAFPTKCCDTSQFLLLVGDDVRLVVVKNKINNGRALATTAMLLRYPPPRVSNNLKGR